MRFTEELVARYVAVWNEPDESRRRGAITEIWSEDGAHFTPSLEARGYAALERRIARTYERYVGTGEHIFAPLENIDAHHGTVKFNWAMKTTRDGDVVAVGFDFLILDSDGRIRTDYQFVEP